ncbi:MAG TPA: hypothetical protein PK872_06045 [Ferruginibacter sp.]|nr:hypothetical protein [Niastella sp.]HRB31054.1 hypothetical protein [Ferruginibacter sp.]
MKILNPANTQNKPLPHLAICILLDAIGMLSFSLPFIGEFSDVIWAPLSGLIYFRMFGGKMGLFGGMFSFLEEILPFTDIIPTFTLSWLLRYRQMSKDPKPLQTIVIKAK